MYDSKYRLTNPVAIGEPSGGNMSGTKHGGIQAAATNKKRYGKDFYEKIGAKGGQKTGVKKGFAANPALAAEAGRKGGKKSKRTKAKK